MATTRNVIGFEMEGAGCWGTLPTTVVKSVCDYTDIHKNKQWQPCASAMATCCARGIIEERQTFQISTLSLPIPYGIANVESSMNLQAASSYIALEQVAIRKAILRGLLVTTPRDDLYAVKQRILNGLGHAPGTCQWIQEHECIREWLDRPAPQISSPVGPPGMGSRRCRLPFYLACKHEVQAAIWPSNSTTQQ